MLREGSQGEEHSMLQSVAGLQCIVTDFAL